MSKLLNSIEHECTGRRFPKMFPLNMLEIYEERAVREDALEEYRLYVKIGACVRLEYPWAIGEAVKRRAGEYLAQHVFGEFHSNIREIREALLNNDTTTGLKYLDDMDQRMFGHE